MNSACLCLKNIGAKKNEEAEEAIKSKSFESLQEIQYPPCVTERATFMSPFSFVRHHKHPYTELSPDTHSHFAPTPLVYSAYSAGALPFRWMQKDLVWGKEHEKYPIRGLKEDFPLDGVLESREPKLPWEKDKRGSWMQDAENHRELLDCFWNHVREEESLVFFYAKQVPLTEEPARRVIVGVGRVLKISGLTEYQYNENRKPDSIRSLLWERMVTHSIRPGFKDGFLLPYHQALAKMDADPSFDPTPVIAFAPADRTLEFSYATEHVSPDGALSSLLVIADALRNAQKCLEGDFSSQILWVDQQITRLWKQRGPCPGLGAVLGAMGISYGAFVANEITDAVGVDTDPWPRVEAMLEDPESFLSPELASRIDAIVGKGWKRRSDTRKAFIRLLSRFDLTLDQAKMLYSSENREQAEINYGDDAFVSNPYLIYESTRLLSGGIAVSASVIDRGVFPKDPIRTLVPVPSPSALKSGIDPRRIRALAIQRLEIHAVQGHTVQTRKTIISEIRDLPLDPKCEVTSDTMEVVEDECFDGEILLLRLGDQSEGYQLKRLAECGSHIRELVNKRLKSAPHEIKADWAALLDSVLDSDNNNTTISEKDRKAREEKVAALEILANRRFSVLIGPAGTGKTTLLSSLVRHPEIADGGVLLLAPTGKARVRMEEKIGDRGFSAKTIAQFLYRSGRFDGASQQYRLTGEGGDKHADTVIIDECSMMTEEMLAATFEELVGVKRFILVGDHRQLPPIGPGKPFVDIVRHLEPETFSQVFPRHHAETGYAELTVSMRQSEVKGGRDDVRLATWFTGTKPSAGEDEILSLLNGRRTSDHLEIKEWNSIDELHAALNESLHKELGIDGQFDQQQFDRMLGATISGEYSYFNSGQAGRQSENWQILTPVRQHGWGVSEINRVIHNKWRAGFLKLARAKYRKICKPVGAEQIVYGDKVINNRNHTRWSWPDRKMKSVANGEIGILIGPWGKTDEINVELSTQPGHNFTYKPAEFSEEGVSDLELAYALTVHRAQGSEFGIVFLILPRNRRMLSREMLYTALTRQKSKIVILCEGSPMHLFDMTNDRYSETKTRFTNLFKAPWPKDFENSYLDANLIHQTERGELVRSKSEVIIADHLNRRRIKYRYEEKLKLGEDVRIPDFTFEDDDTGITYYWEHCGMIFDLEYARRWEEKKALYREHQILPLEEGGGKKGTLIVTNDDSVGGISSKAIGELIASII
jgi:ATP-dependent exoDNAse (exonuclease V) alpha subunit